MNDNHDPQAYLNAIMAKLEAEFYGPRRPHSVDEIGYAMMQVPPFARTIFWEVRDGLSYRQIARRHWITVRRVEREFATALFFLIRALRMIDG